VKKFRLALVLFASLMAMGLVSREWRPAGVQQGEIPPYDVHLKYYEEIRPSLVAAASPASAMCNGERVETAGNVE
jgi:hypothetical protein